MNQTVTGPLHFEFGYLEPDSKYDRYIETQRKKGLKRRLKILT